MRNVEFDWNISKPIEKEMFIDFDMRRQDFLVYIIDNTKKKIITYNPKYPDDAINLVLSKYNQFNIESTAMYSKNEYMYPIYITLCLNEIHVRDRDDIRTWRRNLPPSIRERTRPIYYYEVQGYDFILEDDYLKLYNN